jgi:hypothetical protein
MPGCNRVEFGGKRLGASITGIFELAQSRTHHPHTWRGGARKATRPSHESLAQAAEPRLPRPLCARSWRLNRRLLPPHDPVRPPPDPVAIPSFPSHQSNSLRAKSIPCAPNQRIKAPNLHPQYPPNRRQETHRRSLRDASPVQEDLHPYANGDPAAATTAWCSTHYKKLFNLWRILRDIFRKHHECALQPRTLWRFVKFVAILWRIPVFRHGCALMDIEAQNTATIC